MDTKKHKPAQDKNFIVLRLLSYVPEFKKDVIAIRKEMGIKIGGFEWNKNEMWDWGLKNKLEYYQKSSLGDEEDGTDHFGISSKSSEDVRTNFPSNIFEKKVSELGNKYKLPFNFYAFPCEGLPRYILGNEILAPRTNYFTDFHEDANKSYWTSLTTYAPLSTQELKEAMHEMRDNNMRVLSELIEGADALAKTSFRNQISRDISLFEKQVQRVEKPKLTKKYRPGCYADLLRKSGSASSATLKKAERRSKSNVIVEYSQVTSKELGRIIGISGDAVRQSKRRLNKMAKKLFGYDLEL